MDPTMSPKTKRRPSRTPDLRELKSRRERSQADKQIQESVFLQKSKPVKGVEPTQGRGN